MNRTATTDGLGAVARAAGRPRHPAGRIARRAAVLLAATAAVALAASLGAAFTDGYRTQTSQSGEFVH